MLISSSSIEEEATYFNSQIIKTVDAEIIVANNSAMFLGEDGCILMFEFITDSFYCFYIARS